MLVSVTAIALVPPGDLGSGDTPLLKVVEAGAPAFPVGIFAFITMFAVANTALINMLMASRLLYGMAREGVLPAALGRVHPARRTPYVAIVFTTLLAFGLITFVGEVPELGGTTALLLLIVFAIVNVAVLVLRRRPAEHQHFRAPDDPSRARRGELHLPGVPAGGTSRRPVPDRGGPTRHRGGCAVADHLVVGQAQGGWQRAHRRPRTAGAEVTRRARPANQAGTGQ